MMGGGYLQWWDSQNLNMTGGGAKHLRISFLEAVDGFRVSFMSLCIF